jgi:hypothetical protein
VNRQVKKAAGMQGRNKWKAAQELESFKKNHGFINKVCTTVAVKDISFLEWE